MTEPAGPLKGLLVADFSRVLAGPLATMILGDLGADVVKVERPGHGDDTRAWGPPFTPEGESAYYLSVNRNKRSVVLDLKDPADLAVARRLAERAGALVENFRPGLMDGLGLGFEALRASNPGLVYCSIEGIGPGVPGYDFLAQALGGLMSVTGTADGEPQKVGVALVDVISGLHAVIGILSALRVRDQTDRGQLVRINLLSATLFSLVNQASSFLTAGTVPARMGNRHPSISPYETLATASDPIALAVGNDSQFARLCAALGIPEAAGDRRFDTNAHRVGHREELIATLEAVLTTRSRDEWLRVLAPTGVPCGGVNRIDEAFALASRLGLGAVARLTRADGTEIATVANPLTLSDTPVSYRLAPPSLGEHGGEIRRALRPDPPGSTG